MQSSLRSAAARVRSELRRGGVNPVTFGAELAEIAPRDRDAWLDLMWDIEEIPLDDPALPHGCVPYLPCPVAAVLDAVDHAGVTCNDIFVDVGSGLGRAAFLAHLKTGAGCIGLEVQPSLARAAQARADWLSLGRMRFPQGDAAEMVRFIPTGSVFFLYCPFGESYLRRFLESVEDVARTRTIRVCCVDMPPLQVGWLAPMPSTSLRIDVYRSTLLEP